MMRLLEGYYPVVQALLAGIFTWAVTALGAASVFGTGSPVAGCSIPGWASRPG
jgi:hypothetical protein